MTMKNGFSTINRLLGKHRESSSNLSKSSTNLSVTKSTVNINDSSQVHQNRITPLPIATSNAPFEQTFRITVLLPRDQLYVARLGARVLLYRLLQLVCENKQLDPDKYEFQHPADPSQIFSCDLTIGAVGLSEIRLCNKSECNNTLRVDDVTSRRNSFSSSKFSIRNSKNISNTPSLYSSRNSLNSMSSSGIDSNFRNSTPEVGLPKHLAPVIPARKKRLAPRPPSQNLSIENDAALQTQTSEISIKSDTSTADSPHPIPKTELNQVQSLEERICDTNELIKYNPSIDCNGNTKGIAHNNGHCIAQCEETRISETEQISDEVVCNDTSKLHNSIENISIQNQPEPSPRRKVQTLPKKLTPMAPPRSTKSPTEIINEKQTEEKVSEDFTTLQVSPVAFPRSASTGSTISQPIEQLAVNSKIVSEIDVNQQSPSTPEPNLLVQSPDTISTPVENIILPPKGSVLDDGDEQIDRSWNSSSTQSSETKNKPLIESSSEDDEMIKVYDLKLGKTIVKTLSNHKTTEVLDGVLPKHETEQIEKIRSPSAEGFVKSSNNADDLSEKDSSHDVSVAAEIRVEDLPDLKSSVIEQPQVVSPVVQSSESYVPSSKKENQDNLIIEGKLSQQFEKQRITEEIKQLVAENATNEEIKEVKVDTIDSENFPQKPQLKDPQEKPIVSEIKQSIEDPEEKQESKVIKDTITNGTQAIAKQEPLISTLERLVGDEVLLDIHLKESTIQTKPTVKTNSALPTRSSSFLSLVQSESNNQRNYTTTHEYFSRRRRSSSELSIGESPSLQSLGVIKSILNSRKNSLCGTEESNQTSPTECDIQSMEEPSPKSNNILKTNKFKTGEKEKVYRYSGPPNIHFSTWSDRPKVQVLIKNEQDCVFDGSNKGGGQKTTSNVNKGDLALHKNNKNLNSGLEDLVKGSNYKGTLKETSSSFSSEREMDKPQNFSTTSSMPKFIVGARTSNAWPVTSATSSTLVQNNQNNRPLSQPVLRSTSMTRVISNPVNKQTQPAFGQVTLRKTGYKELIVPLQDNNTDVNADVSKPIPFALKNQTNPQTTPKITKNIVRTEASNSTVPEAPPPPIIRAVVTKQKTNNKTQISLTVDPRDQLLSAIRNFKRDELKNANI